jgi:cyclopropane-fatty-acyl-phospholipid synthase
VFIDTKLSAWTTGVRSKLNLPLRVELWNGQTYDLASDPPRVTLKVGSPAAMRYLMVPSLYNLGRAYVEGDIDITGQVVDIIRIGSELAAASDNVPGRLARAFNLVANHTKEKDAEAIRYHYDVSNEFYQTFLDPNMVYSCAYFETGAEDLAAAQVKKIDHILNKIGLQRGHTLLDIGCGWGALVIRAAQRGAKCIGVTLSENQAALARERVKELGLEGQVEIRIQDYRDVQGEFDRITSVGMFEHVGVDNLPDYFERINKLLAPGGVVMNHGITTTDIDSRSSPYGGGQFIDKYVFPHGELAHLSTVIKTMQQGGLEVRDVENLRRHYARTCATWSENFENNSEKIKSLTDQKHFRIWRVYLAGCAYAFEHDWISLYQIVCGKAGEVPAQIPWSRKYMYEENQTPVGQADTLH